MTAVPPPFKPGVFIGEGVDPGDMGGDSLASETAITNSSDFAGVNLQHEMHFHFYAKVVLYSAHSITFNMTKKNVLLTKKSQQMSYA